MGISTLRKIFVFCGVGLALATGFFLFGAEEEQKPPLTAQAMDDEEGPDLLERGRRNARVTVTVKDDVWNKIRVESAVLDNQDIRLKKKADLFGYKGQLKTTLPPGQYDLRWTVTKPAARNQRITLSFHKTINVPRRGGDVRVEINGQNASVSL